MPAGSPRCKVKLNVLSTESWKTLHSQRMIDNLRIHSKSLKYAIGKLTEA